jgi:hypothetical protein
VAKGRNQNGTGGSGRFPFPRTPAGLDSFDIGKRKKNSAESISVQMKIIFRGQWFSLLSIKGLNILFISGILGSA